MLVSDFKPYVILNTMNKVYIFISAILIIIVLGFIISKANTAISKGTTAIQQETGGTTPDQTAKDLMQGVGTAPDTTQTTDSTQ